MFFIETMSTAELTLPVSNIPTSSSIGLGMKGMNTLSGLGGYMTLGLAAKAKPLVTSIGDDVLIPKDSAKAHFTRINEILIWFCRRGSVTGG